ncbi:30S ribosomal protein S10 [Hibiscus syriacus]|uniref:30S ribosomal protein S10 n=1 Tax=Hibiscus syriacus TaxID=106335 RepID=A0A6A2XIV9_HIBSY|nr:30S ribosomal protein S10 [Hibiscus syriacus]
MIVNGWELLSAAFLPVVILRGGGGERIRCNAVIHCGEPRRLDNVRIVLGKGYNQPIKKDHLFLRYWGRDVLYPYYLENECGESETENTSTPDCSNQECDELELSFIYKAYGKGVGGEEMWGWDSAAPKQKIRIKLKSYWVPLIEDSCKQILDAARTTNDKTMGHVPLPTKKRIYCVLKSPHVHKDARLHFEIRTHQRPYRYSIPNSTNDRFVDATRPSCWG